MLAAEETCVSPGGIINCVLTCCGRIARLPVRSSRSAWRHLCEKLLEVEQAGLDQGAHRTVCVADGFRQSAFRRVPRREMGWQFRQLQNSRCCPSIPAQRFQSPAASERARKALGAVPRLRRRAR